MGDGEQDSLDDEIRQTGSVVRESGDEIPLGGRPCLYGVIGLCGADEDTG